jgi:cobalamin biosynthesis protein CbiG
MVLDQAMTSVAGIGCRKGVTADEVDAAMAAASARDGIFRLDALATAEMKRAETGIVEAAARQALPVILVDATALASVADRAMTRSARVESLLGVPSLAETAALAAAGPGSRLLGPRLAVGRVTCAIAVAELAP